jgi:hypothetical protein
MATYKVIQDIEAEDKLLGPLTLRQFIYATIVVVSGFIAFKLLFVSPWLILPMLPHMILFGVLAAPFGHDQPSEVWLLAKIRFLIKPRRRIWDQSGVKELVTITAPRKIEHALTKNLSQIEVKSRLQALANTIDSRGWAVKNVDVSLFAQPSYATDQGSDRLINPSTIPQEVPGFDVAAVDDILDEDNNPTAQNLDRLINASTKNRREELMNRMQQGSGAPDPAQQPPADYWFLNGTNGQDPGAASHLVTPSATRQGSIGGPMTAEEAALLKQLHAQKDQLPPAYGHMKVILPLSEQAKHKKQHKSGPPPPPMPPLPPPVPIENPAVTAPKDPVILELANNDDLNVATLARQANKELGGEKVDGEVVIKLH